EFICTPWSICKEIRRCGHSRAKWLTCIVKIVRSWTVTSLPVTGANKGKCHGETTSFSDRSCLCLDRRAGDGSGDGWTQHHRSPGDQMGARAALDSLRRTGGGALRRSWQGGPVLASPQAAEGLCHSAAYAPEARDRDGDFRRVSPGDGRGGRQ